MEIEQSRERPGLPLRGSGAWGLAQQPAGGAPRTRPPVDLRTKCGYTLLLNSPYIYIYIYIYTRIYIYIYIYIDIIYIYIYIHIIYIYIYIYNKDRLIISPEGELRGSQGRGLGAQGRIGA